MLYYYFTFLWWSSAIYILSNACAHYIIVLVTCVPFSQRSFHYIPLIVVLVLIICLSMYFNRIYERQTDVDHDFPHPSYPYIILHFSLPWRQNSFHNVFLSYWCQHLTQTTPRLFWQMVSTLRGKKYKEQVTTSSDYSRINSWRRILFLGVVPVLLWRFLTAVYLLRVLPKRAKRDNLK